MSVIGQEILQSLFALQDLKYRDFQAKLMPTVDKNTIIGVRTPELRRLARQVAKNEQLGAFLDALPHTYYDENNLHGFLLGMKCFHRSKVDRSIRKLESTYCNSDKSYNCTDTD